MYAPSWSTFEDESLGETPDRGCADDGDDILHVLGEVDVQGGRPELPWSLQPPAGRPLYLLFLAMPAAGSGRQRTRGKGCCGSRR